MAGELAELHLAPVPIGIGRGEPVAIDDQIGGGDIFHAAQPEHQEDAVEAVDLLPAKMVLAGAEELFQCQA